MTPLLELRELSISLPDRTGELRPVVRDVSLSVAAGESVGLVGESGSGKTMTARSVIRLLPRGAEVSGDVVFDGDSVLGLGREQLRRYRGREVAMIFQDPRAHMNPVRSIGDFLTEALRINLGLDGGAATARATELLEEVAIPDAARRLAQYPHELSGGLLQRVMIASTLAADPRLLLADEPTTALDVTTQSEVMAILDDLRRERGLGLLFITHDLDLAAATCDRTAVMYAGSIVEDAPSEQLHERPRHPYTAALVASRPSVTETEAQLPAVRGRPLSASEAPAGCAFAPRCQYAQPACAEERPPLVEIDGRDRVACRRVGELDLMHAGMARNG